MNHLSEVEFSLVNKDLEAFLGTFSSFFNTLLPQLLLRDFLRKKEELYKHENLSNDERMKEAMSNIPGYMMEAPKLLWDWWKKERRLRQKYDEGELKGAGTKSAQYHENFTTIYDSM